MKEEIKINQKEDDEELLSFQKEIDRRYATATTKYYCFPRIISDDDSDHELIVQQIE